MFQLKDCKINKFFVSSISDLGTTVICIENDKGQSVSIVSSKGCFEKSDYEFVLRVLGDPEGEWCDAIDQLSAAYQDCQVVREE